MDEKYVPLSRQDSRSVFHYHDRLFRFTLILLVSVFVSTYGGDGILNAFSDPDFYWELAATIVFTALLAEWINFITCTLDRVYDWEQKTGMRLILQVSLGVVMPALAEVILAVAWFRMIGTDIRETTFILYAFPLIVMLIAIFNMYYFTHYVYLKWKRREAVQQATGTGGLPADEIPVYFGGNLQYLPATDIIYAYRQGKYNYVKTKGESYVISLPLDKLEETLDSFFFFRLNRQIIAHRACCRGYIPAGYGKLQVDLSPPPPVEQPVVVSQKRAGAFRGWIDLKMPPA